MIGSARLNRPWGMLFNTLPFVAFLVVVLAAYWLIPAWSRRKLVMRHLDEPLPFDERLSDPELERLLTGHIRRLGPVDGDGPSLKELRDFEAAVTAIQSRGGKVLLLTMPTSGLVLEIDERRYPRHLYWDRLFVGTTAQTLHWQDHPELAGFNCPDGSLLDRRGRVRFTEVFVRVAGLERR